MATARISTSLVYGRAIARKETIKAERTAAKEEWIAGYMATPQKRGWPFFRKEVLPTREEAEAAYGHGVSGFLGSQAWAHDLRYSACQDRINAVLCATHVGMRGDGYVTLTAAECAALDFTVSEEAHNG